MTKKARIYSGIKTVYSVWKVLGKLIRYTQKIHTDHLLPPHTRINSKWIKDLNVRPDTIKLLEENIGNKSSDNAPSNNFSHISPQARETKEKINKWDYIKLKSFWQQRKPSTKWKQPTEWENIFTNDTSLLINIQIL